MKISIIIAQTLAILALLAIIQYQNTLLEDIPHIITIKTVEYIKTSNPVVTQQPKPVIQQAVVNQPKKSIIVSQMLSRPIYYPPNDPVDRQVAQQIDVEAEQNAQDRAQYRQFCLSLASLLGTDVSTYTDGRWRRCVTTLVNGFNRSYSQYGSVYPHAQEILDLIAVYK